MKRYHLISILVLSLLSFFLLHCVLPADSSEHPPGWTLETHESDASPDYATVFDQTQVKRIDISIKSADWQAMLVDMTANFGDFGGGGTMPDGPPKQSTRVPSPPDNPIGPVGTGMDKNPVWVPSTVQFEGNTWWHVGIRFKGNSTLRDSWQQGIYKLPLRLDFDQFEDNYPSINNQRFYGFQKISLASNAKDPSYLRDKVSGDIFRQTGIPSAVRAFYQVYINNGSGITYFGLYTVAEIPDYPMLNSQFGDSSGNLYKPQSYWKVDEEVNDSTYPKKSNEGIADFNDIKETISALHGSGDNSSDWRTNLELCFDVNIFLKWLAVNTVIQDWDTYGNMAHNYYLYGNPTNSGKLSWIPWDHNMSLSETLGMKDCLPLDMASVTDEWPLIRNIMDDGLYYAQYWDFVEQFNETIFTVTEIQNRIQSEYNLIAPFVTGNYKENPGYTFVESTAAFEEARDELLQFIDSRHNAVKDSY